MFSGDEGLTCHQFIRTIRERAIEAGHQRNNDWMADYASVRFEGQALKWFESLDDETQTNWKLLRRAILSQYGELASEDSGHLKSSEVKDCRSFFTFTGKDREERREFVRDIRLRASEAGRENDSDWMLGLAFPCFAADALEWHASLPMDVQTSWRLLERAILVDYPAPPTVKVSAPPTSATVSPARIKVEDWYTVVAPSSLQSIRARGDWLNQAKERRRMYQEVNDKSIPCWLLVETEKDFPDNALATGFEPWGELLYSARAWDDSHGLIVGKCVKRVSNAWLPIHGKEIVLTPFEVLVGDPSYFQWVAVPDGTGERSTIKHRPFIGVEAGFEACPRHRAAFICQVKHEGGWHPGKVHSDDGQVYIGYSWKEVGYPTHAARLLAWAD